MVIIAGKTYVDAARRDEYVASNKGFIEQTRQEAGCLDFIIAADPIEAGRINVFERWETVEQLEAFQKRAESPELNIEILRDEVLKYEISGAGPVF